MTTLNTIPKGFLVLCIINQQITYKIVDSLNNQSVSSSFNSKKSAFHFARIVGLDLTYISIKDNYGTTI